MNNEKRSRLLAPEDYRTFATAAGDGIDAKKVKDGFFEITLHDWYLLDPLLFTMRSMSHAVYRGVSDSEHKLIPTLFRIKHLNVATQHKIDRCFGHFEEAMRGRRALGARHELSTYETWGLGRHYGLPTPLLDWTRSPYVALFFAVAEAQEGVAERSVYCLRKKRIEDFQKHEGHLADEGTELLPVNAADALAFHSPKTDDNERLLAQAGLFTVSRNRLSVKDWVKKHHVAITDTLKKVRLTKYEEKEEKELRKRAPYQGEWLLMKINIEVSVRDRARILKKLNRMNINYATLFPDLEGAARYTAMQLDIIHY